MSMKVAVYNLYWATLGGGEQVAAGIAEHLANSGHLVSLLGPTPIDHDLVTARLGRNLRTCSWQRVTDDHEASEASEEFDLFINCTYLSSAVPRSPLSVYYVHFPAVPPTRRQRLISRGAGFGYSLLDRHVDLPGPLEGVRAGLGRRRSDTGWVSGYTAMAANSAFTATWVRRLWGVEPVTLYPPVSPAASPETPGASVVSLGRFFDRRFGHCKKQDVLLEAWVAAELDGSIPDPWSLRLIGGADSDSREYVLGLRRGVRGSRASVEVNVARSVVEGALSTASIFWHAGGFGEDPERHPDRFEHFGIAVVEAMAAGCVPVVFGAAGPAEIVRNGIDGFHWSTVPELVDRTKQLIADPDLMGRMCASAIERAAEFSTAAFNSALDSVVNSIGAP